jgi:hypothetical protein
MQPIVDVHFPGIQKTLRRRGAAHLLRGRATCPASRRSRRTSELLDWLKLLLDEDMPLRRPPEPRPDQGDPAAPRRAAQERAGRDAVRTPRLHGAPSFELRVLLR